MNRYLDQTILAVIVAAVGGVFALDMVFPLGTAVWLLYLVPLTVATTTRVPWAPMVVAVSACVAMTAPT